MAVFRRMNLRYWDQIAFYSVGYLSAELNHAKSPQLTVTCQANWFRGAMTYRYSISDVRLTQIGEAERHPVPEETKLRPLIDDPKGMESFLEDWRDRMEIPSNEKESS